MKKGKGVTVHGGLKKREPKAPNTGGEGSPKMPSKKMFGHKKGGKK